MADIANLFHLRQRKSQAGQAQILAAALFLLLIPTTIIVAQNATDNITGDITANITSMPPENTTENTIHPSEKANTTLLENITNIAIPEENVTINITSPFNEANFTVSDNQIHEALEQEEEPGEIDILGPVLGVSLHIPGRANRNEPFILSAEITNSGDTDANDAEIEWILPDGLSILAGSGSHYCDVPSGAICTSELRVVASLSSELGEQEIKVLVMYLE